MALVAAGVCYGMAPQLAWAANDEPGQASQSPPLVAGGEGTAPSADAPAEGADATTGAVQSLAESSEESLAEGGDGGGGAADAAAGGAAAGAPAGPELELQGLDVTRLGGADLAGAAPAGEGAAGGPQAQQQPPDVFAGRVEKTATLAERAAAIIDRTTIGGYGEHEFEAGRGEVAHFRNHRFVIFVYSQINPRISTATEIEFEFAGSPLKQDGVLGTGEVLLEFSVLDVRLWEWLVLRGGVILVPFGSFNLRHDSPTRDLVDRPIAYTTVVPTTWFESGAGLHGAVHVGARRHRLTYELYAVNGLDARIADGYGLRGARGSHFEDNNQDKAVVGRFAWSPSLGMEIGVSGYSGEYDKAGRRVNMANLDAMWRVGGGFEVLGEAVVVDIDPGYVQGFSESSAANTRDAVPDGMWGFYAQANQHFRVPALWRRLPDEFKDAVCTAVLRYEGKDTDVDTHSAAGDARRLTLGLNFRPIEAVVLKFDAQWNAQGIDGERRAAELWQGTFWRGRKAGFLADRLMTSVAYLF